MEFPYKVQVQRHAVTLRPSGICRKCDVTLIFSLDVLRFVSAWKIIFETIMWSPRGFLPCVFALFVRWRIYHSLRLATGGPNIDFRLPPKTKNPYSGCKQLVPNVARFCYQSEPCYFNVTQLTNLTVVFLHTYRFLKCLRKSTTSF